MWDEKPGKKAAAIYVPSEFDDVANVEQWPAMLDWLLDQHVRFRKAVEAVGGLGFIPSPKRLPLTRRPRRVGRPRRNVRRHRDHDRG